METARALIEDFLMDMDVVCYAEEYKRKDMLVIPDLIPSEYVHEHYLPQVQECFRFAHPIHFGKFKKSKSVGRSIIENYAPHFFDLYYSLAFKGFIERIVGESLYCCPSRDEHGVALYYYTEPGDHIGVHYDKSFYRGKRYTVLLGLIQDSSHSKLICYPGATKLNRRKNPIEIYTHPGTLVIFNGDRLWHEVTPLAANEKRVILTLEYLTDVRIPFYNQFICDLKDRYLYFGKKER